MKFTFRIEIPYLIPFILPFIISVAMLTLNKTVMFSLKDAISVVCILYLPLLIISMIIILTTYCTVDDNGLNIYYAGILKKSIKHDSIEVVEETVKGYNFFALSSSKIRLKSNGKHYIFSIREKELFIKTIEEYRQKLIGI